MNARRPICRNRSYRGHGNRHALGASPPRARTRYVLSFQLTIAVFAAFRCARPLPPLKALAIDAPPLVSYNPETRRHEGIGIDILCFVGERLGVHFEFSEPDRHQPVFDKLRQVQQGQADLILPISDLASRATQGIFSEEFSRSYYAAIGRRDANILLRNASDVAQYRLDYVAGASIEAMLRKVVPEAQLQPYHNWYDGSLFNAVKRGDIDLALYNASKPSG